MADVSEAVGQQAIEIALELLQSIPGVEYTTQPGELEIKGSPGGFDVTLIDDGREATISTDVWHDQFDDPQDAAWYAIWLMSERMRIKVSYRGRHVVRSTPESLTPEGDWIPGTTFGLLFPFFGKQRIEYLSNSVIAPEHLPHE